MVLSSRPSTVNIKCSTRAIYPWGLVFDCWWELSTSSRFDWWSLSILLGIRRSMGRFVGTGHQYFPPALSTKFKRFDDVFDGSPPSRTKVFDSWWELSTRCYGSTAVFDPRVFGWNPSSRSRVFDRWWELSTQHTVRRRTSINARVFDWNPSSRT